MVGLVRTLAPANGMNFDDICSFTTEHYVGIWNHCEDAFAIMAKDDCEFNLEHLPSYIETLDALDDIVYNKVEEHIISVSDNSNYTFKLEDDEL